MSLNLELKNKAFLIADAHENDENQGFLEFLKALNNGNLEIFNGKNQNLNALQSETANAESAPLKTPQLILMGDMFDVLVGEIKATHKFAMPYINLLESLAGQGVEVLYLEGNHDFNLANLFKKVQVFPLQNQPLILKCAQNLTLKKAKFTQNSLKFSKEKAEFQGVSQTALAHGDIFLPPFLAFLLKTLRKPLLLKFLNLLDSLAFGKFSAKIKANQKQKNLFYNIENFKEIAAQRYDKYRLNGALVVEGHYHQDAFISSEMRKYINLPTFAHERSFFVVECD